jgi:hypothetical protein
MKKIKTIDIHLQLPKGELFGVFEVEGDNASLITEMLRTSFPKIPWHEPRSLDTFLQNTLKLAKHKNYTLHLAVILKTAQETYFYCAGGAIVLLRGKKSGRLLASQDYHILTGSLDDGDQLILSSSGDEKIIAALTELLQSATTPAKLFNDLPSDFLANQTVSLLHIYGDKYQTFPRLPTTATTFVHQQRNFFILGLFLLFTAGFIAILINYHLVGKTLETISADNPEAKSASNYNHDLKQNNERTSLFYDLTLATNDFSPQQFADVTDEHGKLAFLDASRGEVLILDLVSKAWEKTPITATKGAELVTDLDWQTDKVTLENMGREYYLRGHLIYFADLPEQNTVSE